MRVLVCGGRDLDDRALVFRTLDRIHRRYCIEVVINGGATGADNIADEWARARFVDTMVWAAEWKRLGVRAGPTRNALMLRRGEPHVVVAFPGGRGTKDMVRRAREVTAVVEVDARGIARIGRQFATSETHAVANHIARAIRTPLEECMREALDRRKRK